MKFIIVLSFFVAIGNCQWIPSKQSSAEDPEFNICASKIEEGNGNRRIPTWGYSLEARACVPFTYRGLKNNRFNYNLNRFASKKSCEDHCSEDNMCNIKYRGGPCPPSTMAYGFDPAKRECIKYAYGKCGGRPGYVFHTKKGCENFCSKKSSQ